MSFISLLLVLTLCLGASGQEPQDFPCNEPYSVFSTTTGQQPSRESMAGGADAGFENMLTLYMQTVNVTMSTNATVIILYPFYTDDLDKTTWSYNVSAGLYWSPSPNNFTLIAQTYSAVLDNFSGYNQQKNQYLNGLYLAFPSIVPLSAGNYTIAFWSLNMTSTTPPEGMRSTVSNINLPSLMVPYPRESFSGGVPSNIYVNGSFSVAPFGALASLVEQDLWICPPQPNTASMVHQSASAWWALILMSILLL